MVWVDLLGNTLGLRATSATTSVYPWCLNSQTTSCTQPVYGLAGSTAGDWGLANCTTTTSGTSGLYWTDDMDQQAYFALAQQRAVISREHCAAIEAAQRAAQRAAQERYEQEARERARASALAMDLLLSHLTRAQRETFEKNNWFVVQGGKTKTKYRINGGRFQGNIDVFARDLFNERITHRLCCHCPHDIPLGDQLLAQKLCLQYDEENFIRIANRA